jgi:hypothetical protein
LYIFSFLFNHMIGLKNRFHLINIYFIWIYEKFWERKMCTFRILFKKKYMISFIILILRIIFLLKLWVIDSFHVKESDSFFFNWIDPFKSVLLIPFVKIIIINFVSSVIFGNCRVRSYSINANIQTKKDSNRLIEKNCWLILIVYLRYPFLKRFLY